MFFHDLTPFLFLFIYFLIVNELSKTPIPQQAQPKLCFSKDGGQIIYSDLRGTTLVV